jgi:hypothetical protein
MFIIAIASTLIAVVFFHELSLLGFILRAVVALLLERASSCAGQSPTHAMLDWDRSCEGDCILPSHLSQLRYQVGRLIANLNAAFEKPVSKILWHHLFQ